MVCPLSHPLIKANSGGEKLLSEGATDLSLYFPVHIENSIPSDRSLLDTLSDKDRFYLGNNTWAIFTIAEEQIPFI